MDDDKASGVARQQEQEEFPRALLVREYVKAGLSLGEELLTVESKYAVGEVLDRGLVDPVQIVNAFIFASASASFIAAPEALTDRVAERLELCGGVVVQAPRRLAAAVVYTEELLLTVCVHEALFALSPQANV